MPGDCASSISPPSLFPHQSDTRLLRCVCIPSRFAQLARLIALPLGHRDPTFDAKGDTIGTRHSQRRGITSYLASMAGLFIIQSSVFPLHEKDLGASVEWGESARLAEMEKEGTSQARLALCLQRKYQYGEGDDMTWLALTGNSTREHVPSEAGMSRCLVIWQRIVGRCFCGLTQLVSYR